MANATEGKKAKRPRRGFTNEQKVSLVAKINADIKGGMQVQEACKKNAVGPSQYRAWKEGKAMTRELAPKPGGTITTFDVSALPKPPKKKKGTKNKPFSERRRATLMARIEKLISKKKMNASDAAREVGINPSSYYLWKRKPELATPPTLPAVVNGVNGHAKPIGPVQIALQVSGISLAVAGQPVSITLQDAIRLQEGLDRLLQHHR